MKMNVLMVSLLLLGTYQFGFSQKQLLGLWEGVITDGGIHTDEGFKFQLYILEINKNKLVGRSYVYLSEEEVVEMDIEGVIYGDRSIYFRDINFVPLEGGVTKAPYNRKYEVLYNRSIWDTKIEGYWQEIMPQVFADHRQRGRIKLKKAETAAP
ncbi:MAG: hypothetical protein AAF798_16985 [Bacteroidota bacterium]